MVGIEPTTDIDGDGKSDVLFQHADGYLAAWYMDGASLVQGVLLRPATVGDARWRVVGYGDFNGDGKVDVLFQHDDGSLAIWYMDGAARKDAKLLNPMAPLGADGKVDVRWRAVAAADLNGDRMLDVVFQYSGGSFDRTVAVWFLTGVNQVGAALLEPANPGASWSVVGAADYNQDGKTDLLFQHSSGLTGLWYLDGVKLEKATLLKPETPGAGWRVVGP